MIPGGGFSNALGSIARGAMSDPNRRPTAQSRENEAQRAARLRAARIAAQAGMDARDPARSRVPRGSLADGLRPRR